MFLNNWRSIIYCTISNVCVLSLSLTVTRGFFSKAPLKSLDARKKGVTSVYAHISVKPPWKKQR
jgi:hypothetical protein